jgi:phage tail-like protein
MATTTNASKYYIEFDGLTEMPIKSIAEVSYEAKVTGNEKAIESTKGGRTNRQTTSGGFDSNPSIKIEAYLSGDTSSASYQLYQWFKGCLPASDGGDANWKGSRKNASITVYDPDGRAMTMRYDITTAWIKGYSLTDGDATGSDLAVETFEFVCEKVKRVQSISQAA